MKKFFSFLSIMMIFNSSIYSQYAKVFDFKKDNYFIRPAASLVGNDSLLYGNISFNTGGKLGSIIKIKTDGSQPSVLHEFHGPDGSYPRSSLFLRDTMLYGTTYIGGQDDRGTLFKISVNGNDFTTLIKFSDSTGSSPECPLTVIGDTIFGTTSGGGANYAGTIFKINIDGTGFVKLMDFDFNNGFSPKGPLIVTDSIIYGTTSQGGDSYTGLVFSIRRDGSDFKKLYNFPLEVDNSQNMNLVLFGKYLYGILQNGSYKDKGSIFRLKTDGSDFSIFYTFVDSLGTRPVGPLTLAGSNLYGMTSLGAEHSMGSLFKIDLQTHEFKKLRSFTDGDGEPFILSQPLVVGNSVYVLTNKGIYENSGLLSRCDSSGANYSKIFEFGLTNNGFSPIGALVGDGKSLFGLTQEGGANGNGVLYGLSEEGTEFRVLLNINKSIGTVYDRTIPIIEDSTIFWTAYIGGKYNSGTICRIQTNGEKFKKIFDFNDTLGAEPFGELILKDSVLFGTTIGGGKEYEGVIFKINKDGSNYTILKDFGIIGYQPFTSLTLDNEWLYGVAGTTYSLPNKRVLFKIKIDGTGYKELYFFNEINSAFAVDKLTILESRIYGITEAGGPELTGYIFSINKDGTGFKDLADLKQIDCVGPRGSLIVDKYALYGTILGGGINHFGAMFKINSDGSDFSRIIDFDTASTGGYPGMSLMQMNNKLYGINNLGGEYSFGTIYSYWLPPNFIVQPRKIIPICPDGNGSISINALGKDLAYEWHSSADSGKSWFEIPLLAGDSIYSGWDSNKLTISNLTNDHAGYFYRCLAIDAFGRADTSAVGMLALNAPLTITKIPVDIAVCNSISAAFKMNVSGFPEAYQWQIFRDSSWINLADSTSYSGASTNNLKIATSINLDSTIYRCITTGFCAEKDTTASAVLYVHTPPHIFLQPENAEVDLGYFTAIQIRSSGTKGLYQWQENKGEGWVNVEDNEVYQGSNIDSMALVNVPAPINGTIYRCIVSNMCPPADTSITARICVNIVSTIVSQPKSVEVLERWDTAFSVSATGVFLSYKWEESNGPGLEWNSVVDNESIQGSESPVLKLKNISLEMNGFRFRCIVTGNCGTPDTSIVAILNSVFNSVEKLKNNSSLIHCYPNPAKDEITIRFSESTIGKIRLSLYSITGQAVVENEILKSEEEFLYKLKLSVLPAGIYYLQIQLNQEELGRSKIIIER
jgi:uncharacterized repeat protein (TIGR03803 family)